MRLIHNFSGSGVNSTVQVRQDFCLVLGILLTSLCVTQILKSLAIWCIPCGARVLARLTFNLVAGVACSEFGDFITFCRSPEAVSTSQCVESLFCLLGRGYADSGEKAGRFDTCFQALGIQAGRE